MSPLNGAYKYIAPSSNLAVTNQSNQWTDTGSSFTAQLEKAQLTAQKLIRKKPKSGEGYLTAGEVYKQQGHLRAALAVYEQGLLSVPPTDSQYARLQKEAQSVSATLLEHHQMFQYLNPYDIWCLIFAKLNFRDLLRCTSVCQTWSNFISSWPKFWEKHRIEMPQMERSGLEPLIRRQAQEFWFDGPLDISLVVDLLKSLAYTENHVITKLCFNKLQLSCSDASYLAIGLGSTSSSVKRVEFIECKIPKRSIIDPILESCVNLSHLTFSRIDGPLEYYSPLLIRSKNDTPSATFSSLTYLKLSFQYMVYNTMDRIDGPRLCENLAHCPNLVHLFLDSKSLLNQDDCVSQVQRHCPYLRNLVMTFDAEMPPTVVSQIDCHELDIPHTAMDNNKPMTPIGLVRLVLSGGQIGLMQEDIVHVFKKNSRSLSLLYLHYGHKVGPHALGKLARRGAPRLREIRLSTEDSPGRIKIGPPIQQVLTELFSRCPVLEVIEISDKFSCGIQPHTDGYLKVDDQVLVTIAKSCPLLRHLKIVGRRRYLRACMVRFSNVGGQRLSYLEMDMARKHILEVVKKLPLLRYLHVRKDSVYPSDERIPLSEKKAIQRIIEHERGGQLILDRIA
ncbi:hypothetical protein BJV82DRAFT_716532 [Fennellomyces sp. T-0311]|nr:hypothetical protein BJV82DRAFT_716532 [Fennellomyces sp. T-0311]